AKRDIDLADMVSCDRCILGAGEIAGIDRLLDGDDPRAYFLVAEANEDLISRRQRLVMQPENSRMNSSRVARRRARMRDDVAALDEQLAVERDADGATGAKLSCNRRDRPALDRLDPGDLARGHDDDLVARGKMT